MNELQPLRQQSAWVAGGLGVAGLVILIILITWLTHTLDQRPAGPAADERPRTVVNQPSRHASETTPCRRQNEPIHTSWVEALKDPVRVCSVVLREAEPFPDDLAQFKNLLGLTIVKQELTALPPQIGKLTSLQALVLANNQLTTLPAEIGQLPHLETLILSGNPLERLPAELAQLTRLRHLNLQQTALSAAEQARIRSLVPEATIKF